MDASRWRLEGGPPRVTMTHSWASVAETVCGACRAWPSCSATAAWARATSAWQRRWPTARRPRRRLLSQHWYLLIVTSAASHRARCSTSAHKVGGGGWGGWGCGGWGGECVCTPRCACWVSRCSWAGAGMMAPDCWARQLQHAQHVSAPSPTADRQPPPDSPRPRAAPDMLQCLG